MDDYLETIEEIHQYTGWSCRKLKRLARRGFPMAKVEGRWVSSKRMIEQWRCKRIKEKPPYRNTAQTSQD